MQSGFSVQQKIEHMKESGSVNYEKAGDKKKRLDKERLEAKEREKMEKEGDIDGDIQKCEETL